ncbi:Uncharacterised protein [Serratia liquefaciens]|uniref:hypothetical protein n=1 Tax=Serratia liquefaciens TaxID=614 RepID=UPI00217CB4E1|nr:hypothetical protein [Serratia liquefaciens]CAI0826510.1 Uncharacterised protein [Serratia liquefaciens]
MAKNEFLPFGTAANANVLPNADYQALPARVAGFSGGVAKSEELTQSGGRVRQWPLYWASSSQIKPDRMYWMMETLQS